MHFYILLFFIQVQVIPFIVNLLDYFIIFDWWNPINSYLILMSFFLFFKNELLNFLWGQVEKSFCMNGILDILGQAFEQTRKFFRRWLGDGSFDESSNNSSDIGEINQISIDVENGSIKQCIFCFRAHFIYDT